MSHQPPTVDDILASPTAQGLPAAGQPAPAMDLRHHYQAVDNMIRVFAIRPGDEMLFLTDPRLDRRVVDAISGIAMSRGVQPREFMAPTTQISTCPEEARALVEKASFVVSSWFCSVNEPLFVKLRRDKGQRWIKITYFRNLDLLQTPQARFPVDLVGEIIRATARLYPRDRDFDMVFSDPRGSDLTIKFTPEMVVNHLGDNRWRGEIKGDEDGCYVHYLPTHGPNIYGSTCFKRAPNAKPDMGGVIFPQWAVGFAKPFEDKIGLEFKDGIVDKVHGKSLNAEILRDMLVGNEANLGELGLGFNPKAPRYTIYPAGPNSPGALHFGTTSKKPSTYFRKVMPHWEEPAVHLDAVTFDATVKLGGVTMIDNGFLVSLRDPQVVAAARAYGDPTELLETFVD